MNTTPTPTPTPAPAAVGLAELGELAVALVERFRAHFPVETERERQVLALAEEAGELVGAYRRAAGMARRSGPWSEVEAELADVVITAYVTGRVLDVDLDAQDDPTSVKAVPTGSQAVLQLFAVTGWFVDTYTAGRQSLMAAVLAEVVTAARHTATVLDIDLDAAIAAKTAVMFSRGWRDAPSPSAPAAAATSAPKGRPAAAAGEEWPR
ncbi:hypothetical protein [Actinomadura sp. 6N118]|uniref:hypothetical protein n=1 Tax=Actinomadura sp. 6N118 TaxID=3375151 RepID=UPI0037A957C1